ncbi:MAG: hypothetical protein AB7F43_01830 [Bacteriovoracia bacterium]
MAERDFLQSDDEISDFGRVLEFLKKRFDNFTFDRDKDFNFFLYLFEDFPDLDIEEELKQFHAWTLDQDPEKPIYYRSRFRTWLKRSRQMKMRRRRPC